MGNWIGKRFGLSICAALFSILGVGCLLFVAVAQDTLTEDIVTQIETAAYDPDMAAGIVRDAVANTPQRVEAIVRTAVQAASHLSVTLTAAAVVPASDQVALIQQAAADAMSGGEVHDVATAAEIAAKVVAYPERDTEIVSTAIRERPGQSSTVVMAAATVCKFVEGCSPITPMPIVAVAVALDRQAAEGIVEAAVSLFPGTAGEIIAAATQSSLAPKTVRKRAVPRPANRGGGAPVTTLLPVVGRTPIPESIAVPEPFGADGPALVAGNTPPPQRNGRGLAPSPHADRVPRPDQ